MLIENVRRDDATGTNDIIYTVYHIIAERLTDSNYSTKIDITYFVTQYKLVIDKCFFTFTINALSVAGFAETIY